MFFGQTGNGWMDYLQHLLPQTRDLVDFTVKIVQAAFAVVVIYILSRLFRRASTRFAHRNSRNPNLAVLIGNLVYAAMLVLAFITVLTIFTGAGFSSFLTLLGIFSVAISLAIQDVLRNFVAGVYILLERPFNIGDRITLRETVEGFVETIELRTTNIRTDDGVQIIIPNNIIFSEIVVNRTAFDKRLHIIRLTLAEGQKLTDAISAVKDALIQFPQVSQHPPPQVTVESIKEGKAIARVQFYTPRNTTLPQEALLAIQAYLPGADVAVVSQDTETIKTQRNGGR